MFTCLSPIRRYLQHLTRRMPARTSVAQRFEMFDHTVAGMEERLFTARAPAQMMTALRWGLDELDRAYAETPAGVRAKVACRSGCAACCHVPVDVQAHEVFFAADHIQVHFSPVALTAVIARLARHRDRTADYEGDERLASRKPCPLLRAGACSIYAGRPEACRSHHSSDAALCAANQADASVNVTKAYLPALRARMFAVMMGLDEAMEACGYDERCYDFGSALHEALTNSRCLMRWLRRQPAFPDRCLAVAGS
jgi:Fe-S-cluster containining protein